MIQQVGAGRCLCSLIAFFDFYLAGTAGRCWALLCGSIAGFDFYLDDTAGRCWTLFV
jgi:hypothetical protein